MADGVHTGTCYWFPVVLMQVLRIEGTFNSNLKTNKWKFQEKPKLRPLCHLCLTRLILICFLTWFCDQRTQQEPPSPEFCALELQAEVELKAPSACGASCPPGPLSWFFTASISVCWVGPSGLSAPISCNTH